MRGAQRHLLLIACSQRKRTGPDPMPALERYDGNTYRMIRKLRREGRWPFLVDVLILSAEFGLIEADKPILNYERRMSRERATELRPTVLASFQKYLSEHGQYASIYIDLGKDYLPAIEGIENLSDGLIVVFAQGRIGQRLGNLKQWLLERWREQPIVPFFVADRPKSLQILKGVPLQDYPGIRIGIMAHANTTPSFQAKLHDYPCDNKASCEAIGGGACPYDEHIENCPVRAYLLKHTIKMCDSGIFTREGATLTYERLFETYRRMGVEYGVMIDVFQDSHATLESAREALRVYKSYKTEFRLVGVAQGETVEEYLDCYRRLREMGFTHVAVGGLLRRIEKSARYTRVRDESFMYQVLDAIRSEYPDDWLFALGCLHPNRLAEFTKRRVWGDYKGWIFQYEKIDNTLNRLLESLNRNDLRHLSPYERNRLAHVLAELERVMVLRARLMAQRQEVHKKLLAGRRNVREDMVWLYRVIKDEHPDRAASLKPILTHALLDDTEARRVESAVELLDEADQERGNRLVSHIYSTRAYKSRLRTLEARIAFVNSKIANVAEEIAQTEDVSSLQLVAKCQEIARLVNTPESEHRAVQTRKSIVSRILEFLGEKDAT